MTHSRFVLQGAPSVRVRQRLVQRSLPAAHAHHRALSSPSNPGTVPPSPRLPGGGGGRGGRRPGSGTSQPERRGGEPGPVRPQDREPGGEEETGESPEERGRESGTVMERKRESSYKDSINILS